MKEHSSYLKITVIGFINIILELANINKTVYINKVRFSKVEAVNILIMKQ